MSLRAWVQSALHRRGYGIAPYPLSRFLDNHPPSLIVDVGANVGQFAQEARQLGYRGRIVSFEPLPEAFAQLQANAASDPNWDVHALAIGDAPGESDLHVASNLASSSLRPPAHELTIAAPSIEFNEAQSVRLETLDAILPSFLDPKDRVLLKVDVQGYEDAVLRGFVEHLSAYSGILLELSLIPLYQGEPAIETVIAWLRERGFAPAYFYPAYWEAGTRRWHQADVLFLPSAAV